VLLVLALTRHTAVASTITASSSRRRLEDAYYYGDDTFEYNVLSDYSVRFVKCQHVKMFDDDLAEDEDAETVLATKQFVVYNMCPSDTGCGSYSDSCSNEKHGAYVLDLADYLDNTVEFQQAEFEYMCNNCNERCNENGEYCDGCGKICYNLENLENNGYVDASEYMECQELDVENDDDDDNGNDDDDELQLYIGPKCSSDGESILIGLFTDENCWEPYQEDVDVEDVLGVKLSYHLLSTTVRDGSNDMSVCLSCKEQGDDDNDNNDADDVNEMCENVYAASAKCESIYGLEGGFVNENRQDQDYENQVETEFMVCTFIDSLIWNSYTETGEINIDAVQDEIIRETTVLQIAVLSGLAVAILGMIAYAYVLSDQITKSFPPNLIAKSNNQLT